MQNFKKFMIFKIFPSFVILLIMGLMGSIIFLMGQFKYQPAFYICTSVLFLVGAAIVTMAFNLLLDGKSRVERVFDVIKVEGHSVAADSAAINYKSEGPCL